jgi:hypothetical protein
MAVRTIIKTKQRPFTMDAIYAIFSSAVIALLFTAGWSIAVGRRLQTIDDLKSGFIRLEDDIKHLEESITKLVDKDGTKITFGFFVKTVLKYWYCRRGIF